MHRAEHAELARHVVRARRNRTKRRAPQNEFVFAEAEKVREIRMSAGKLLDGEIAGELKVIAHVRFDGRPVELLAGTHGARFTHFFTLRMRATNPGRNRFSKIA